MLDIEHDAVMASTDIRLHHDSVLRVTVPYDEKDATLIAVAPEISGNVTGPQHRFFPKLEVNGQILYKARAYRLPPGASVSVVAWNSCKVRLRGSDTFRLSAFKATHGLHRAAVELHCLLQQCRENAKAATTASERVGPRIVICGAKACGKHSLMTTLANYAARFGWTPVVVDGSLSTQQLSLPTSIGVASWDTPSSLDMGTTNILTTAVGCGLLSPHGTNPPNVSPVYSQALMHAIGIVNERLNEHLNDVVGPSGSIVLLPNLPRRQGADLVTRVIDELDATHVAVMNDDYLLGSLQKRYATALFNSGEGDGNTSFVRNGGLPLILQNFTAGNAPVNRTDRQIREEQSRRFDTYFKGTALDPVLPRPLDKPIRWADFYRFAERKDGKVVVEQCKIEELIEKKRIQNYIGMVYDLPPGSGENVIPSLTVQSFVHLRDAEEGYLSLWATCGENGLPKKPVIVLTELTWLPST